MKKRLLGLLLGIMLVFGCVGCGAENATTEPTTEAVETTTTSIEQSEVTDTPEETTASTPEETEQAEEVVTETTKTEVASAEEPEATTEPSTEEVTPEPTEEPEPEYTYTDMTATMYATQTVNVRDLPDTSGNKVGSLSTNDEITISGQCNETSWYRFEYNGNVAYVSNKYVGENKVEVQQQATANNGSEQAQAPSTLASNSGDWKTLYSAGTWYDMGEFVFIIEYGNDWTMQHNWSDWEGKYPYVDFSGQAKTDDARIFFAYSNPNSKELSNFLRQYTH